MKISTPSETFSYTPTPCYPTEFNLPLKPPSDNLSYYATEKADRLTKKIEALKTLHFPIQKEDSLKELFCKIKELKALHKTALPPDHTSFHTFVMSDGNRINLDIYPHPNNDSKKRNEIVVSFPFPENGDLIEKAHITRTAHKNIGFGWLVSKTPQRFVRITTPAALDSPASPERELQKKLMEIESFYLQKFNKMPHFPEVYKGSEMDEEYILLMKYYPSTLFALLKSNSPLDDEAKIKYAIQILSPLAHMHQEGICHNDVKFENYLIDDENHLFLNDFSYAYPADLSEKNHCMGTTKHMSWEKLERACGLNSKDLSKEERLASDVWAAGQILLFLFFGVQHPYCNTLKADSITTEELDAVKKDMETLNNLEPPKTNLLSHLVWEMLQVDPQKRPSASEVIERLQKIQKQKHYTTDPLTIFDEGRAWFPY